MFKLRSANYGLLIFACWLGMAALAGAQNSPSPTPSPTATQTPISAPSPVATVSPTPEQTASVAPGGAASATPGGTASATPGEIASPTPEQTPSLAPIPTPTRTVRLTFVPPPMHGTISLGIFDANRDLVRVLFRDAKIDSFIAEADALTTTWDGTDDAGGYLPAGRYRARGYMVGDIKVQDLGKATAPPPIDSDHAPVRLVANPLLNDTRSVIDLGVGFDAKGCFIKTMDDLPLYTVSKTPHLVRAWIAKSGKKSVYVWQDDGAVVEQFRVSNIDKIMAFDCGFVELQ